MAQSTTILFPELRSVLSLDLDFGSMPPDPSHCSVLIDAEIGVKGQNGASRFGFTAITPSAISARNERRWGRGYLILPEFSWDAVSQALQRLLAQSSGPSWEAIAAKLNKELLWEFDNYQP
jgi:hypothetical protein